MSWQDATLAIGGLILAISLLPTLKNATARIPLSTSITLSSVLFIFSITFVTLGLWWSAIGSLAQVGCWSFIACWRRA